MDKLLWLGILFCCIGCSLLPSADKMAQANKTIQEAIAPR